MGRYHVGERVRVNISTLSRRPGATRGLFLDPTAPPAWVDAIVEGVEEVPYFDDYARYAIRILHSVLAGSTGAVGPDSLQPPPQQPGVYVSARSAIGCPATAVDRGRSRRAARREPMITERPMPRPPRLKNLSFVTPTEFRSVPRRS